MKKFSSALLAISISLFVCPNLLAQVDNLGKLNKFRLLSGAEEYGHSIKLSESYLQDVKEGKTYEIIDTSLLSTMNLHFYGGFLSFYKNQLYSIDFEERYDQDTFWQLYDIQATYFQVLLQRLTDLFGKDYEIKEDTSFVYVSKMIIWSGNKNSLILTLRVPTSSATMGIFNTLEIRNKTLYNSAQLSKF